MSTQIVTILEQTVFRPGDVVRGCAHWTVRQTPQSVTLQLFYYTDGKGTRDVVVHELLEFDTLMAQDLRQFEFELPAQPWSFSGKLLSVRWAIELVVKASPKDELARLDLVVSPTGESIDLYAHDALPGPSYKKSWFRSHQ